MSLGHVHRGPLGYLQFIPLPGVVILIYNLFILGGNIAGKLNTVWVQFGLPSGAPFELTAGQFLIVLAVIALYVELVKATRTGSASIIDHGVSLFVFGLFLVEFVAVQGCGTGTFLVLGLIALLDVVAGFTISIVAARRDLSVNPPMVT